MKIFDKVDIRNDIQRIFFDSYKYEMKLSLGVIIVCILAVIFISYKSPIFLSIAITFQLLVYAKYLYDRRVKLKKDIDFSNE